ncbi:MAG: hypothetical protein A2Y33_16315 [Spirochaetes bacterium GWF1_51_8]|nr:MAG: hypothetical protein A2Y33_16315 [Spirochaetes bacterium GWF1_51_8]
MNKVKPALALGILLFLGISISGAKVQEDIFYHGFFYSKDGAVTFQIPKDISSKWMQVGPQSTGDYSMVKLFLGNPKSYEAQILIMVFPKQNQKVDTKNEVLSLAKDLQGGSPYLKSVSELVTLSLPGGKGHQLMLQGKSPGGVSEAAVIAFVANGGGTAAVMVRGNTEAMEKQALPVTKVLLQTLRLGPSVGTLPKAANPGVALDGVWVGPFKIKANGGDSQSWLVFDKNGYVTDSAPYDLLYLDMQALYSYYPNQVGTYHVSGGQLKIKWISGGKTETYTYKNNGNLMTLDKDEYKLVSGKGDGMTLEGEYEAYDYSSSDGSGDSFSVVTSSTYWFDKKGNFKSSSMVGMSFTDKGMGGETIGGVEASSGKKSQKGKYKISKNQIVFSYDNGTVHKMTFYPYINKQGKLDPAIVYMGGENYLLDD